MLIFLSNSTWTIKIFLFWGGFPANSHQRPDFKPVKLQNPIFVQTSTALAFTNPSFSAILIISHIQLVLVSSVWFFQGFHKTETSTPAPLPSGTSHIEHDLLLWLRSWRAFPAWFAVTSLWSDWATLNAAGSYQYYTPCRIVGKGHCTRSPFILHPPMKSKKSRQ